MATSGSYNMNMTAANIITAAFENLGEILPGGTVPTAHSTMALTRLGMIAKQYSGVADGSGGIKVHTRQRVTMMMAVGQQAYLIGPAATDARASTLVGRTTIDAAEAAGQTVLSVTATNDTTTYPGTTLTMTASDFIGIEQNDGTIFWTTVSSISAGDTVTVAAGLDVAAAVGNYVWWFTARAQRFPVIEAAVLRNENRDDIPLTVYIDPRQYELGVANKYADGTPTAILVEPLRITTRVTLDAQPTDITSQLVLTVLYPSEDYDATTDDVAYPQEAFRFLAWELAYELHPGIEAEWTPAMEKMRLEARQTYLNLNPENSILHFQPNA